MQVSSFSAGHKLGVEPFDLLKSICLDSSSFFLTFFTERFAQKRFFPKIDCFFSINYFPLIRLVISFSSQVTGNNECRKPIRFFRITRFLWYIPQKHFLETQCTIFVGIWCANAVFRYAWLWQQYEARRFRIIKVNDTFPWGAWRRIPKQERL